MLCFISSGAVNVFLPGGVAAFFFKNITNEKGYFSMNETGNM